MSREGQVPVNEKVTQGRRRGISLHVSLTIEVRLAIRPEVYCLINSKSDVVEITLASVELADPKRQEEYGMVTKPDNWEDLPMWYARHVRELSSWESLRRPRYALNEGRKDPSSMSV